MGSNPLRYIDPLGLIHYNAPAPRTVPVTGENLNDLQCVERCLAQRSNNRGLDLLVTGGAETTGHSRNSRHSTNEACDISTQNPIESNDVFDCAEQCGFGGGQLETFSQNPNRNHWHLQQQPGNGVPDINQRTQRTR